MGLAALSVLENLTVTMADLDETALKTARRNVRRHNHGGRCAVVRADVRLPAPASLGQYDVIACNPPYIPTGDIALLEPSVRDHEPHLALDGGADGLELIRAVAFQWASALVPGGALLLEIGIGQAKGVSAILRQSGFCNLRVHKDSGGIERVVEASLPREPAQAVEKEV